MKILYIATNVNTPQYPLVDYQNDCLLLGLKEHFGDDVVDCNKRHHLYTDFPAEEALKQYGMGFTLTRILESDNADREDIRKKIANKFFDLVVYGNIWRNQDYLELVLEHYPKNKIAMVDGEDNPKFHPAIAAGTMYVKRELDWEANREYEQLFPHVAPIQFAFPTSKIFTGDVKKDRKLAHSDPRNRNTYVFKTEEDYYNDYRHSKYAVTMKKAGWDALRHYEIMGNNCMPLFQNLQDCPRWVMMRLPKALLIKIMYFHLKEPKYLEKEYDYLQSELMTHFKRFNTTYACAKYFQKEVARYNK